MENLKKIRLSEGAWEYHAPAVFSSLSEASQKLGALAKFLKGEGAQVVSIEAFAPQKYAAVLEEFKKLTGSAEAPTQHVLPLDEVSLPELAGAHVIAVKGADVEFKSTKNNSKAAIYKCGADEYCRVFGVCLPENGMGGAQYTKAVFKELEGVLRLGGFKFSDLARTWFYNRDILGWYSEFNKGRTEFFRENKVFDALLPASTGIGSPNPAGTRIQAGLIAVKDAPKNGKIFEIESPLQCGATKYGSSFARAIEMKFNTYRRIMVSGTASIAPTGETLYFGDIARQVELTMRVIGAILKSRGMDFKDASRAVVYCMKPEYYEEFLKWQKLNAEIAHVPSYSTVCRSDLMFEVELDAFVNT
ncbi:MAG: hypothetical protein IKO42_01055 [Opitutales bacterium]|nr:hypothetical protein [Opitutales bacterium]